MPFKNSTDDNSKTKILRKLKTQIVMKFKNTNCDELKNSSGDKPKTERVTKFKNLDIDKISNFVQTKKNLVVTKLKL